MSTDPLDRARAMYERCVEGIFPEMPSPALDLRHAFPHAVPLEVHGHPTLQDGDFNPGCGYISMEEAAILYRCAQDFAGVWLELGSHTGWSGAHIAAAGCDLVAVEPQFCHVGFYRRARDNWLRAGVWEKILPVAQRSTVYLEAGGGADVSFSGAFVDGDHEPGMPLADAQALLPRMAERSVVVFHDAVGEPVQAAVAWLAGEGFEVRMYETMARLTVCWRGDWQPVA